MDAQIEFRMNSKQHSEKGVIPKSNQPPPTDPMAVFTSPFDDFGNLQEVDGATSEVPFLVKHKTDIVCGPCIMESFSEMPSFSGSVSLTSSELMASRDRSFLLYIGTVEDETTPPPEETTSHSDNDGKTGYL